MQVSFLSSSREPLVSRNQVMSDLPHLFTQPLRLQYLNLAVCVSGMRQQLLLEIERRTQVEFEYRRIVRDFGLLLRGVQGQRAKVVPLDARYANPHLFWFVTLIDSNAERIGKKGLRVKILGQDEQMFRRTEFPDAVQRIDAQPIITRAARHDIPPLVKYLDAIRCHLERMGRIAPEALVGHPQRPVVAHRLDDLRQKTLPGGNLLEKDAPFEVVAFVDEVVHGKGVQQPCPHAAPLHVFGMLDVVKVAALAVALDIDIEHLLDGVLVVVKGLQGKLFAGLVE